MISPRLRTISAILLFVLGILTILNTVILFETANSVKKGKVKLFSDMGADVSLYDIDIAHRVPQRNATAGAPKPIICKFVRRLSKEAVMARRNDTCKADPSSLGFGEGVSLSSVRIFDHVTPKMQYFLTEGTKFKGQNNYQFCWTKNSCIYLRKDGSSRALKIRDIADLTRLGLLIMYPFMTSSNDERR